MEESISNGSNRLSLLPPGLSFCPTDEDLVLHFLYHNANSLSSFSDHHFSNSIIPRLQLHLSNPWQLHGKALSNGDVHYFFSTVEEISKATESGYWKDVSMDEPILCTTTGDKLGIKKFHIFFFGHLGHDSPTPNIQTSWVMQEYRIYTNLLNTKSQNNLPNTKSEFGLWSLCRVFETKDNSRSIFSYEEDEDNESELSYLDEMYLTFDDI